MTNKQTYTLGFGLTGPFFVVTLGQAVQSELLGTLMTVLFTGRMPFLSVSK